MSERAIIKYEKPRLELANNGIVINCGVQYASIKSTTSPYDSCGSNWDNLEYVYPFDQMKEAMEKLMEFGKLAGLKVEYKLADEDE